jgi:putative hemolysin
MERLALEILVLVLLVVLNGVFAMAEIAIVSARPALLEQRAIEGETAAAAALELYRSPGHFLSTVQVGITSIGIVAGAFGGTTLGANLGTMFEGSSLLAPYSRALGVGLVVVAATYLSLIIGELVPKRIALSNPERIAAAIARPMKRLATLARPVVRFLSGSTNLVLTVLGVELGQRQPVTEDEIRVLLRRGAEAGTFEREEQELVERVFRVADRRLRSILTPRPEIVWLDLDAPGEENHARMIASRHARFPVCRSSLDNVVGVVRSKELLAQALAEGSISVERAMRKPTFVPENMPALEVLETFKQTRMHFALVMDEYGGLEGLVTTNDILDALVGELPEMGERGDYRAVERDDGTWLVDGAYPTEDFKEQFGIRSLPQDDRGIYDTLGGFLMLLLERIPREGDQVEWDRIQFEVVDMDGLRVDKVLLRDERRQ